MKGSVYTVARASEPALWAMFVLASGRNNNWDQAGRQAGTLCSAVPAVV